MLLTLAPASWAHPQPTTLVMLDVGAHAVSAELHVPLNELELAFGHAVTNRPEANLAAWREPFASYIRAHVRPTCQDGTPWTVQVGAMTIGEKVQTQSGAVQEVSAQLILEPPGGAGLHDFILNYDLILHQVVTHRALVSIRSNWARSNWAAGQVTPEPPRAIFVDTGTGRIEPLRIHLDQGGAWHGFRAMVELGARHIREGSDHLLFLLALFLPAGLRIRKGAWGGFGGSRQCLLRLAGITAAFTLGHSLTLLAGALRWLVLPQSPVEVLIACSVLITAVHAIRPLFPGREIYAAAGFGLVHGLAFATALTGLKLDGASLSLSILGFNLGIELMQILVIALTAPWLILLGLTPAHAPVRIGGALFAALASCGWILSRVTGNSNAIERAMNSAPDFAPLGILLLAVIAIPAYFFRTKETINA
jgi:hypothetical protein